jgi:transglutaminase-like putative cysteine protease
VVEMITTEKPILPPPPPPLPSFKVESVSYEPSMKIEPAQKDRRAVKIFAAIIVLAIILASSYLLTRQELQDEEQLWDPGFDVGALITQEDSTFYNEYPSAPMLHKLSKNTMSMTSDILFGREAVWGQNLPIFTYQLERDVALYDWVVEAAQVTPSMENLCQRILQDVGSDPVDQAKAIFDFVSKYLMYVADGAYEFPVTSLLERQGQCSEYATLLTSLYMVAGFDTYYVFTSMEASQYLDMYHIWVALYLPEFTPTDPGQNIITSRLGAGWIGLDTTGNQCKFGELYGALDYHSNIVSIIEPVTSVTIYDVEADWEQGSAGDRYVHLDLYLKTWNSGGQGRIDLTFSLFENGDITDTASYSFSENSEENIGVDLSYNSSSWEGKTQQYITISVA